MSARITEKSQAVARCIQRQDGQWLVITQKGTSGISPVEVREGAAVLIRDGVVERLSR